MTSSLGKTTCSARASIMSFLGRERDREFELELLRIQLKHDIKIALYSSFIAVGVAFKVFGFTPALTVTLSEKEISFLWILMITLYPIIGGILSFSGMVFLGRLKSSEEKDLERIRKKYLDWTVREV